METGSSITNLDIADGIEQNNKTHKQIKKKQN
jgi:hypothetical protein